MTIDTYRYVYSGASTLTGDGLLLQTSGGRTDQGVAPHPRFFTGFLASAQRTAAGMLVLADLARTDFRRMGTERTYRDPVVTSDGSLLRMEAFSACCGAYGRLDVLGPALDGETHAHGTTNVDINPPLYTALTRVGAGDPLRLSVGPDELAVTTLDGAVVERRVPLPERWLRGLAEVPAQAARMDLRAELSAAEAASFLGRLPARPERSDRWLLPAGRSLRATVAASPGAVCLAAGHRLGIVRPLLPYLRTLRVYGPPVPAGSGPVASGWELDLGDHRFVLLLSPGVNRGFSGEGGLLHELAADLAVEDAETVAALLGWTGPVDIDDVTSAAGFDRDRVRAALAVLATAGRVGYDLTELAYFRRELPYDVSRVEELNPRLRAARQLVADAAVRPTDDGFEVRSGERTYLVHRTSDGRVGCTCPWWAEHRGGRGPCKHVLATSLPALSTVEVDR